jgi:hypothetical protein
MKKSTKKEQIVYEATKTNWVSSLKTLAGYVVVIPIIIWNSLTGRNPFK